MRLPQPYRFALAPVLLLAACGSPTAEDDAAAAAATSSDYCERVKRLGQDGAVEQVNCGITRGPKAEKTIALVFTAGYFCEGGPAFLDTLKEHDAKASFFILSAAARAQDAASKCNVVMPRLVSEGHYVGPHSDTHPEMVDAQGGKTKVTRQKFDAEVKKNIDVLRGKGVTGNMRYWMPPSETFNDQLSQWSAENGLATVHLTDCPQTRGDYLSVASQGGKFSNDAILKRVFDCEAKDPSHLNGAILFFHLGVGTAREDKDKFHNAFPTLMKTLVADGYKFVRIDEMLDATAGGALGAP